MPLQVLAEKVCSAGETSASMCAMGMLQGPLSIFTQSHQMPVKAAKQATQPGCVTLSHRPGFRLATSILPTPHPDAHPEHFLVMCP